MKIKNQFFSVKSFTMYNYILIVIISSLPFLHWWFQMDLARILFHKIFEYSSIEFRKEDTNVYLTIDDVLQRSFRRILKTLKIYDVKCTFFLIGSTVTESNRKFIVQAIKDGHHFANHGMTNTPHWILNKNELAFEIEECQNIIDELYKLAKKPSPKIKYYRPGSGFVNNTIYNYSKTNNYQIVLGDVYPIDPRFGMSNLYSHFIQKKMSPGSIIILHDRWWTPKTLRLTLPKILQKYKIVPLN